MPDMRYPVFVADPATGAPKEGVNVKITSDGGATFLPSAAGVNTDVQGEAFIDIDTTAQYTVYFDGSPSGLLVNQTIIILDENGKIKTSDIAGGGGGASVPKTITIGTTDSENTYDFPATAAGFQDALNDATANDIIIVYESLSITSTNITLPNVGVRVVNHRSIDYTEPTNNVSRTNIELEDSILIGSAGQIFFQGFNFTGIGTSGIRTISFFADNCSFLNDDGSFGALTFEECPETRFKDCYFYDVSFDLQIGGGVSTRNIFFDNCQFEIEGASLLYSTSAAGNAIVSLTNCEFLLLDVSFFDQSANMTSSTISGRTAGVNTLAPGAQLPDFAPFNDGFLGFWISETQGSDTYPELYKYVVEANDQLLEQYYPFRQEVSFSNLAIALTATALGSDLQWDSTVNGCVTMEYVVTNTAFGNTDLGASGSLRIVIQGNTTSAVFLNDENRMEVDISTPSPIVFSVDVLSNFCRLLYSSTSEQAIKFFNIKYVTFTNGIVP